MTDKWVEVSTTTDEIWDYREGQVPSIEGIYTGRKYNIGPKASTLHQVKTLDGKTIGVWGSKVLNDKLSEVGFDKEVKIVYRGKSVGKSGTSYHDFAVFSTRQPMVEVSTGEEEPLPPEPPEIDVDDL